MSPFKQAMDDLWWATKLMTLEECELMIAIYGYSVWSKGKAAVHFEGRIDGAYFTGVFHATAFGSSVLAESFFACCNEEEYDTNDPITMR